MIHTVLPPVEADMVDLEAKALDTVALAAALAMVAGIVENVVRAHYHSLSYLLDSWVRLW